MGLLGVLLLGFIQQDPHAVLASSARRSVEADRKAALEQFRSAGPDEPSAWIAARFLERPEREWRLRYDRLTTREGSFAGRVEGGTFYAFSGKRFDASQGRLERDAADPAAADLDAILAKYGGFGQGEEVHAAALTDIAGAFEKFRGRSEAAEIFRHFALAHVGALGERATAPAGRLALACVEGRWGTPEQLNHFRIVSGKLEAAGRGAPWFGTRYAAAILRVERAFADGAGFEGAHRGLLETGDGPRGSAEHLKALATGVKNAVYCKDCKGGKATCGGCKGKGKRDVNCAVCAGQGRVRPSGAIGNTDVTVKCRNCDGLKVFRGVGCPDCGKSGMANCGSCLGRPWRDRPCSVAACSGGRVPCGVCKGNVKPMADCPVCAGKGRNRASGAVGNADVTVKCRGCEGRRKVEGVCVACNRAGTMRCEACKDGSGAKVQAALTDVYVAEPCRDCAGAGFPLRGVALACPKCFGMGLRVKPAADPTKILD